jgi:hypothetical protein
MDRVFLSKLLILISFIMDPLDDASSLCPSCAKRAPGRNPPSLRYLIGYCRVTHGGRKDLEELWQEACAVVEAYVGDRHKWMADNLREWGQPAMLCGGCTKLITPSSHPDATDRP